MDFDESDIRVDILGGKYVLVLAGTKQGSASEMQSEFGFNVSKYVAAFKIEEAWPMLCHILS
jgi:hypothetical protein